MLKKAKSKSEQIEKRGDKVQNIQSYNNYNRNIISPALNKEKNANPLPQKTNKRTNQGYVDHSAVIGYKGFILNCKLIFFFLI